jgi:hypothetical protein
LLKGLAMKPLIVPLLLILLVALAAGVAMAAPPNAHLIHTPGPNLTAGTACQDVPKLTYNNGPLIQHVKVVDVFYSPGHKYKAMLESYYKAITQSAYFDWLVEYNTTSYKIGRGSFLLSFEDTNANPTTVKQVDPKAYLTSLLTAKKLPAPDADTMYMLYFPSGVDPADGTGSSCIANGDYCAYHDSFSFGGQLVRYGVMPDMEAGGCSQGCGPPGFPSFTDVSAHELIEAVTDPDNGTGWLDPEPNQQTNCGEIGDICATGGTGEAGTVAGFLVQKEWSNKNNKCIVTDPNVMVNDFTVAVAPAMVSVPAGGSVTATVTLTKTSGMADTATLSAVGLPATLTATFAPASASSAGGTATVTLSAAATSAIGTTATFQVKATGASVAPTADVSVVVVGPPDMASSGGNGEGGGANGGNGSGTGGNGTGSTGGAKGGCSFGAAVGGSGAPAALPWILLALARRRRRARR